MVFFSLYGTGLSKDPNDPFYREHQQNYLEAIKAPEAWDRIYDVPKANQTVIAVIGQGMMSDHEDLRHNAIPGYNMIDKNTNTSDRDGTGTNVAGAAGAVTNNSIGIAGIAGTVKLMPIVYDATNDNTIAASIDYAINASVDIIIFTSALKGSEHRAVEASLVRAALANISFIFSAGDDAKNMSEPGQESYPCQFAAKLESVMCVAGTRNDTMNLYDTSNYAPFVNVAAPAIVVTTSWTGAYYRVFGTPMSAAIVAGIVALMKGVASRPLTTREVQFIIRDTSTPGVKSPDGRTKMKFGRVNALRAVEQAIRLRKSDST